MRIVVLGYIVRGPLGGLCWHYLQYMLGLKQLGHEVLFLEDSDNYPSCYNPDLEDMTADPGYGLDFIDRLFRKYDLVDQWAYYDEHKNIWHGKSKAEVFDFCGHADIILNISNVNPLREWWSTVPAKVLIDTDPVFTQIRHLEEKRFAEIAAAHTHYFSFGENFGKPGCLIPDDGFNWKPTRQPVVTSIWPVQKPLKTQPWTTVMQWDSYKSRKFRGIEFGMKSVSFKEYFDFPQHSNESFELAVGSPSRPKEELEENGWLWTDPLIVTKDDSSFMEFIQHSKGEFSVAKHGYVASNSGWFSERSANYLASGRPVIVQDTGFTDFIETGKGLHVFSNPREAHLAIEKVNADFDAEWKHAREIAIEYFEAEKILSKLLKEL